jgi:hypothetical protein
MSETLPITREQVVREARNLLGVRWVHQGRDPKFGIDCLGMLICISRAVGYEPQNDFTTYRRRSPGEALQAGLEAEMDLIPLEEVKDGDVVRILFPRDLEPRHVGIIATGLYERMIIHCYEPQQGGGKVCEEPLRRWLPYVVSCYRWKGIVD